MENAKKKTRSHTHNVNTLSILLSTTIIIRTFDTKPQIERQPAMSYGC